MSNAPEVLTILSGRESSVRRLDLLRAAVGDNPVDWYPALTGHAWPGANPVEEDLGLPTTSNSIETGELPMQQAAE